MGCQCTNTGNEKMINIDNIINDDDPNSAIISSFPVSDYTKKVFKLINKIRENPTSFSSVIENSVQYITSEKGRLIFSHKLKVALHRGIEAFQEAAEELRNTQPMSQLSFKDDIVIECPEDENSLKDVNIFKEKVLQKKEKCEIDAYFKDALKEPEISVLLMIIDDAEKNSGKKRHAILNKDLKFIGISSANVGNIFCAYLTFSK